VPIEIPSQTAIVLNSIGVAPAARIPAFHMLGQISQMRRARHDFDPRMRDAN